MSSRVRLTLKEKVDIIKASEQDKLSTRALAAKYKIGKTQASEILKNKKELLDRFIKHGNEQSRRSFPKSPGLIIDNAVFEWFCRARAAYIPISGPLIREKALEVAQNLGQTDFKASEGWLDKFKTRHNISYKTMSGEGASIQYHSTTELVTDWLEKLQEYCADFEPKNIFNCDETALFFRALPEKTVQLKDERCKEGKISKERLTVLLCTNMFGEFETPLVIGKTKKPRCFEGVDINLLHVDWHSNTKAWMTREIMTTWLTRLNNKMICQNRKIMLLMDNAASHRKTNFSNVTVVFLAPNLSATCQPLGQGILKNFKTLYRKCMLRHLLANMDNATSAHELAKNITILDAIHWITSSVNKISKETVLRCFVKSGFVNTNGEGENPQNDGELQDLLRLYDPSSDLAYADIDERLDTENNSLNVADLIREDESPNNEEEPEVGAEEVKDEEPPMTA
ncbi:unnamed protein product, partial [Tenebrio molitor]